MQLHGRAFMVTGGCSGLGAATVRVLLDRGARVLVADINEEAGEELASGEDEALFVRTDVTDEESIRAAIDAAQSVFGGLDGQRRVFEDIGCLVEDDEPDFTHADEVFKTLRAWHFELSYGELLEEHSGIYVLCSPCLSSESKLERVPSLEYPS